MPDYQPHINSDKFSRPSWRKSFSSLPSRSKALSVTEHSGGARLAEFDDDYPILKKTIYKHHSPENVNMSQPPIQSSQHSPIKSSQQRTNSASPGGRHRPPVASILTKASSFDSMITVGHSPKPPSRVPPRTSHHLPPRSLFPQHASPYPMASRVYDSYPPSYPPPGPNDMYYPHHALPLSDHFHPPHYSSHPYHHHPYMPNWHLRSHTPNASLHPPMIVSSSSIPAPPVVVEYVTELGPHDVLSGRGGATNSYRGNRAFRTLVKEYQEKYLRAKKRDKPAVASLIVEAIRQRGGRFLRRENSPYRRHSADGNSNNGGSMIQWVDIGDDRAREKTCQALREGAPELRRQGRRGDGDGHRWSSPRQHRSVHSRSFSFDDEDATIHGKDDSVSSDAQDPRKAPKSAFRASKTLSHKSKQDRPHRSNSYDLDDADDETPEVRNSDRFHPRRITKSSHTKTPVFIRPWARLLPDRLIEPILLSELSLQDRDFYLCDFAPPRSEWKDVCYSPPQMAFSEDSKRETDPTDLMHDEESFSPDFGPPVDHH